MYQDKDTPSRIAGHPSAKLVMFFMLLLFPKLSWHCPCGQHFSAMIIAGRQRQPFLSPLLN